MKLTADHIRFAKPAQLALLTGIDASSFSAWTNTRHMSGRMQARVAGLLGMDKLEFIKGFEARKQDALKVKKAQEELDELLKQIARNEAVA